MKANATGTKSVRYLLQKTKNRTVQLHGLKWLEKFGVVILNFASQSQLSTVYSE